MLLQNNAFFVFLPYYSHSPSSTSFLCFFLPIFIFFLRALGFSICNDVERRVFPIVWRWTLIGVRVSRKPAEGPSIPVATSPCTLRPPSL